MPSDGGGEVFSFFVEKLDLGDAAAAAPGVGGDGEVERQTKANWMRGLHLMFFLVHIGLVFGGPVQFWVRTLGGC